MMEDVYIGQMLDNRYEILEKIGTGGMAVVYKARCHRLNRFVAIKILKSDLAQDADLRRRFYAESQAVAMLSHPNIVSVYDVSHSDEIDYIVMELVEGITLKQYINRKGVLNWKEALHFSSQIAKALSHAHSRGIIHRDIKPQNIMILKDGSVKVADFGIARLLTTQNTLTQEALGSVHYISPEQAKGSPVDTRSDIYSLGVVMYEMLTSRLPFEGESAVSVAIQHISSIPLMPRDINPDIPVGLEQITMHAMQPNLDLRYASADDIYEDLEEFRKNPSVRFGYESVVGTAPADDPQDTRPIPSGAVNSAVKAQTVKRSSGNAMSRDKVSKAEYSHNRQKSGRTSIFVGVLCIFLFLLMLFVFMWNYFLKDMLAPQDERTAVPSFVGKYIDQVLDNSKYTEYFNFTVETVSSDTYEKGYIMQQNPAADRQMTVLATGIEVTLTVSAGKEETELMPDIINMDYREAELLLEGYKLKLDIKISAEPDESITVGYVTDQFPAKDEPLLEGSSVYITYSSGPDIPYVEVPPVVGLTESRAISKLQSMDLSYEVEHVFDDVVSSGKVVFQNYDAGESIPIHTKVTIQVSKGPEIADEPITGDEPVGTGENTQPPDPGSEGQDPADSGTGETKPQTPPQEPVTTDPSGSENRENDSGIIDG